MDYRRLNYFLRISELGSLSRAADRLRIAQPALSRQMHLLEQEVGLPLFIRHRRGVALTEVGEELRSKLIGPMRQIEIAVEDMRSLSRELGGQVALGMPPTVGHVLAGPLARRIAARAPNVSLRIVEGYGGHLVDWLQRGEIDIAILYGPVADFRLSAKELVLEELMLVGPPDCALQPDVGLEFERLSRLSLILPSHPHGLRLVVDGMAAKMKIKLEVRFQADSFALMKELVESGLGYTVLPLSSFAREATVGRLRYAPFSRPRVMRHLMLAKQPGADHSRATHMLERFIHEEITELIGAGHWKVARLADTTQSPSGSD